MFTNCDNLQSDYLVLFKVSPDFCMLQLLFRLKRCKMKFLVLLLLGVIAASGEESQMLKDFAVRNNLFAADVYTILLKSHSGNFLVCPLSAEIILALVHNGAGGKTAQQLSSGLYLPENKEQILQAIQQLSPHLEGGDKYTLNSANKIYVKDGFKIKDQFKSTAVDVFKSDIQSIEFEKNVQAAAEMNGWVEEKTHGKIKGLINNDDLDEHTRAVLINTMYFHGQWLNEFPHRATQPKTFYLHNNKQIQVDMMQQLAQLNYFECSDLNAKFLELPYEGNDVTMTIVLPNDKDGLPALEAHIAEVLVEHKFDQHLVELKIPKFEIKSTIEFKPIMEELGIVEPFQDTADFNGILVDQPLKISKVIQKTFIEVEEKGTTASAATAVEMPEQVSLHYEPPPVIEFLADHPFIYFIKIKDIVFFVGRYTGV